MRTRLRVHDDRLLRVLLHVAGADHLAEQAGGCLALARLMLEALYPGSELG